MSNDLVDLAPLAAALAAVPLYIAMQILALIKLHSGWRYAAVLPLLMAITLVASMFDGATDGAAPPQRTLLLFSPGAIAYLAVLALLSAAIDHLLAPQPVALPAPPDADALVAQPASR